MNFQTSASSPLLPEGTPKTHNFSVVSQPHTITARFSKFTPFPIVIRMKSGVAGCGISLPGASRQRNTSPFWDEPRFAFTHTLTRAHTNWNRAPAFWSRGVMCSAGTCDDAAQGARDGTFGNNNSLMHECRHRLTRPETPVAHEQRGNRATLRPDKQPSPLGPPPNNDTKVCQKQYLTRPRTTCSHTAAPRKSVVLAFGSCQISA